MNIAALGGMDLATMKALISGGNAVQQLDVTAAKAQTLPTDALTLQMQAKMIDAAQGGLDVYA